MPACSVCTHPKRAEIDKAIVTGESLRSIADRTGTSKSSLVRHRDKHLSGAIQRAEQRIQAKVEQQMESQVDVHLKRGTEDIEVHAQLAKVLTYCNKLIDACDRWLTDPDDSNAYDIGARASDIKVIWEDRSQGRPVPRKAMLSELLERVSDETGPTILAVESKYADPRELILKTAAQLRPSIELLGKVLGTIQDPATINIFVSPDYLKLRSLLVDVLSAYPDARIAVAERLAALEATAGA